MEKTEKFRIRKYFEKTGTNIYSAAHARRKWTADLKIQWNKYIE